MKKHRSIDRPVAFVGKVVFEFFNNEDEDFKNRSLKSLVKELRKEFNVSCVLVEEHEVENPERGTLVVSLCAVTHDSGKAPARILSDQFEEAEIT
jgi:hypothetical protein